MESKLNVADKTAVSLAIDEKEKEIQAADDALDGVVSQIHENDKKMTDLEIANRDLKESARKARHNLRKLERELDYLKRAYWRK